MKEKLAKKNKSLKSAIERYNTYSRFIESYAKTKSLDEYAEYVRLTMGNSADGLSEHYERLLYSYEHGYPDALLSNLYDRLLAADEYKKKVTEELKALLREYEGKA